MMAPPKTLRLDGVEYEMSKLSPRARETVGTLRTIEADLNDKTNMLAVLTKAHNAYISDLKSEIIKEKSGVDISTLFDAE
ncbi:MAG: hypothetical protein ABF254_00765 [Octadecabacter sp.]